MKPQPLLERFGIDQRTQGAGLFLRCCYAAAVTGAPVPRVLFLLAREAGVSYDTARRRMSDALAPVLDAPLEELWDLGLPFGRRSVVELAAAVADELRSGIPTEITGPLREEILNAVISGGKFAGKVDSLGKTTRPGGAGAQGLTAPEGAESPAQIREGEGRQ